MTGIVFNIQRFSIHDGPGIRTTVFLKGCPLRCPWCHNPEGVERRRQVRQTSNLCLHCGRCVPVCEFGGHEVTSETHGLHLDECTRCGKCVEACVVGALEMVGEQMTVEQVLSVVRRDNPFYEQSGGGMTLSGGEPLMQFAFSKALLQAAKAEGMHTAIQTSASAPWERLEALLSLTDYWMVDLKHTNNARHKELTGVPNRRILNNLRRLCESGSDLLLRVPWIPGYNVEEGFLQGLVRFLTSMPKPPPVEFMLYHRLGLSKTTALGKDNTFPEQLPAATAEDVAPWIERLRSEGLRVVGS